ncbi:hypothetical protein AB205_0167740, partial [Aquarana catesbeiana]
MRNQTILNEFLLSGLSDLPALQHPLFFFFLLTYLLTLIWNFLIIILVVIDSHLHVPMYFFLGNLADIIESFFCDFPQLLQISCSDIYINILLIFILGGILAVCSLTLIVLSYVSIFRTVLKIKVKGKMSKVFSTCTSHLTVVFIFYCSSIFNYFRPSPNQHFAVDKVASVFYAVMTPLLNPLIYSLRNQDFRRAFYNVFRKIVYTAMGKMNLH